jgi:hypothetical protein
MTSVYWGNHTSHMQITGVLMQVILHTTVFEKRIKGLLYFREETLISVYNIKLLDDSTCTSDAMYQVLTTRLLSRPIPLAARSKEWVCGRSLAGIWVSNPAGDMDVLSIVNVVCCQVEVSVTG